MKERQYWVVGAMFGGRDDQLKRFIKEGYWYCWDAKDGVSVPKEVEDRFPRIKQGDRIAVKKLLGRGAEEIEIRALGTVKNVDLREWRIYIDWLVPEMERRVPIKGCVGSINGPFKYENEWVREVFCP